MRNKNQLNINDDSDGAVAVTKSQSDDIELTNFRRGLPQFLAVGVKNVLLFGYGMTLGFPTIVIPAIQGGDGRESDLSGGGSYHEDIILNKDEISWFSSINLLCVPLGCIFSGMFTQPIGKRMAMQIVNVPILMAWLLFHFSTNIYHLYAGLCLAGLSGGLMEAPVLTYVAEITEPRYRGMLAATGSTCLIFGVFFQFLFGTFFHWRTVAAISTIFPIISITALFFVPESPHWLMVKGRYDESKKALAWLRGWTTFENVEAEYNRIYDAIVRRPNELAAMDNTKPTGICHKFHLYTRKTFLLPFALVTLTFFVGHFGGKTSLQTYAVQIFHTLKAPIDKYYATMLLGVVEIIGSLICVILVHYTGKRPLVLASTIGCGLCFLGTATYARFLDVVPGVVVDNIVANVSSLDLNRLDLITALNVSHELELQLLIAQNVTIQNNSFLMKITNDSINNNNNNKSSNDDIGGDYEDTENTTSINGVVLFPNSHHPIKIADFHNNFPAAAYRTRRDVDPATDDHNSFDSVIQQQQQQQQQNNSTDIVDFNYDFNITDDDEGIFVDNNLLGAVTEISLNDTNDQFEQYNNSMILIKNEINQNDESIIPHEIVLQVPKVKENIFLWLPLTLLLLGAMFAHMGIKLIPWMLIGEVFPASVRSGASGISGGTGYLFGFLANKLFLQMLATMTLPGTFWFYSSISLVGALILYFVLPETEGHSLMEIEEHFSGGKLLTHSRGDNKNGADDSNSQIGNTTNSTSTLDGFTTILPISSIIINDNNPQQQQRMELNDNPKRSKSQQMKLDQHRKQLDALQFGGKRHRNNVIGSNISNSTNL